MKIDQALDEVVKVEKITAKQNDSVMRELKRDWNLGPENASPLPDANPEYWKRMGKVWMIPVSQARRQLCANCEYFDNTPEALRTMESVAINKYDRDGGGRGYCHKFDFICHNLRTCQAWERKDFELED